MKLLVDFRFTLALHITFGLELLFVFLLLLKYFHITRSTKLFSFSATVNTIHFHWSMNLFVRYKSLLCSNKIIQIELDVEKNYSKRQNRIHCLTNTLQLFHVEWKCWLSKEFLQVGFYSQVIKPVDIQMNAKWE